MSWCLAAAHRVNGYDLRYSIDPSPTQQELGWAAEETFDADSDPR
jgi:dTDP-D-glucose 4,6-dehydratase